MLRYLIAMCAMFALALASPRASANLSNYSFEVMTGTVASTSGGTTLWEGYAGGARNDGSINNVVQGVELPFTFVFDGIGYTRVSISSNGVIGLGDNDITSTWDNSLIGHGNFPVIAPYWDELTLTGGAQNFCSGQAAVSYKVNGTAPNRVFVVDWRDVEVAWRSVAFADFQVRLYEGSNVIEFFYTNLTSESCRFSGDIYRTSGTIGIAASPDDFMSVTPDYGTAYADRERVNDEIDLSFEGHRISQSMVFRFAPCNISLVGNLDQGGTATMSDRDTLFRTTEVQRGDMGFFQPFSIENSTEGCGPRNFRMSIDGEAAGDYSLEYYDGTIGSRELLMPTITFAPTANGPRNATLTITDDNNFSRTFALQAIGGTRIEWTPNLTDGGTATLADGDTLMRNVQVPRHTTRDLQPFTLRNFNTNFEAPAARISVSLDSAGFPSTQYELVGPTSANLLPGETFTPTIRFTGEGVGPQNATLTVVADEQTRVFTLRAISAAPAIAVTANGVVVDAENPALNLEQTCVGELTTTVPFVVRNSGYMPLTVTDLAAYLVDTTYQQGTPMMPLLRDAQGRPIPVRDYIVSTAPGTLPLSTITPVGMPFTVQPGETRQLYLTFVGSQPGKRFGRMFIRTNAENIYGVDTNAYDNVTTFPTEVLGLFTTDLTARAVGSRLASNAAGLRLKPVIFPHTHVGDTATMSFTIANNGACDLRINRNKLRIFSGDVNEFSLMTSLRGSSFDQATGDFLLAPGTVDTLHVRFIPSRAGTRLATLWIQTNDSTIIHPGVAERGAHYLDLHGRGLAGLDGRDLVLDPVVIGNSVTGTARLENTLNIAVGINSIFLDGGDAAQFGPSGWPTLPVTVLPGSKLELGVTLTPTGDAGTRRTTLVVVTTTGDTIRVPVRGEAGLQQLTVSPTSLFQNVTVAVSQSRREMLMITNSGTLPVRITSMRIIGPDSLSYRMGSLPRMDLEPGQTEYLEMTFAPTAIGLTSAQLEITASNGQRYLVQMGGNAQKVRLDPADPTNSAYPVNIPESQVGRVKDGFKGGPTLR